MTLRWSLFTMFHLTTYIMYHSEEYEQFLRYERKAAVLHRVIIGLTIGYVALSITAICVLL